MTKKILITIFVVLMMAALLFLGCNEDNSASVSDETQTDEENAPQESEETDDIEEEEAEAEEAETDADGEQDAEETEETEAEIEEEVLIEEGEVTFMTEDNIELSGTIFGGGNKWVILSHMSPTDQTSWFEFAEMIILEEEGYSVLTYDFRGYGKSGGTQDVSKTVIDLTAALEYIEQYDPELIYLMGASMGGTASIVVAYESFRTLDGVISFSGPGEFEGVSAIDVIGDLVPAKLFIASQGDGDNAQAATEMFEKSMEPKWLEILDGSSHGTFIFEQEPENAKRVEELVLNFLY